MLLYYCRYIIRRFPKGFEIPSEAKTRCIGSTTMRVFFFRPSVRIDGCFCRQRADFERDFVPAALGLKRSRDKINGKNFPVQTHGKNGKFRLTLNGFVSRVKT